MSALRSRILSHCAPRRPQVHIETALSRCIGPDVIRRASSRIASWLEEAARHSAPAPPALRWMAVRAVRVERARTRRRARRAATLLILVLVLTVVAATLIERGICSPRVCGSDSRMPESAATAPIRSLPRARQGSSDVVLPRWRSNHAVHRWASRRVAHHQSRTVAS